MRRLAPLVLLAVSLLGCTPAASAPITPITPITPTQATTTQTATPTTAEPAAKAATLQLPPVNGRADYQLGGPYTPVAGVTIVSRDRTERPARGVYSICYVNAFQTQPEESAWWRSKHPSLLVQVGGRPLEDPDWPGEYLLDTSTAAKRTKLAGIVGGWIDGCARSGFRAVEPDNLDTFTRSKKKLTMAGNLAYAKLLADRAHRNKLAIAQKNTAELTRAEARATGFDFAVAEECQVYDECGAYTAIYGNRVIEIEYTDTPRRFYTAACAARGKKISIILRDRDVVPRGSAGYRYEAC